MKLDTQLDSDWYAEAYPDIRHSGLEPSEHFSRIGSKIGRFPNEQVERALMVRRFLEHADYDLLYAYVREKDLGARDHFLQAALGLAQLRAGHWSAARSTWRNYFDQLAGLVNSSSFSAPRFNWHKNLSGEFTVAQPAPLSPLGQAPVRVCVYTTLFGDYDTLRDPLFAPPWVDFICFTDKARHLKVWDCRVVDPGLDDDNLNAKIFKVLPHHYLAEYEYSLFVDASTLFFGNIDELLNSWLLGREFVMWRHPDRVDLVDEATAIMASYRHEPDKIIDQVEAYLSDGMPGCTGLAEASFIWRDHRNKELAKIMEQWWREIGNHSKRDQLSLAYLFWRKDYRPQLLPGSLGSARRNIYFEKMPHQVTPLAAIESSSKHRANPTVEDQIEENRKVESLIFLYDKKHQTAGSTVMRCFQLSDIAKQTAPPGWQVNVSDSLNVRDAIVIVSKGALKKEPVEKIRKLKANGNFVLLDFVDDPVLPEAVELADGVIAASIASFRALVRKYPGCTIRYVTHHTDPRLKLPIDLGQFKAGYFGELLNTFVNEEIEEFVEFHRVDTKNSTNEWIDCVPNYSFHYAVRKRRDIDGFKPFLKGFTAAKYGCPILIDKNEGDAIFYLGSQYPYYIQGGCNEKNIIEGLRCARDTYGTDLWNYAVDVMKSVRDRSRDDVVASEIWNAIDAVIG